MTTPTTKRFPVIDQSVTAVLDVLAPRYIDAELNSKRMPIFEWGHETAPTENELQDLAADIVAAVLVVLKDDRQASRAFQAGYKAGQRDLSLNLQGYLGEVTNV